MFLTRDEEAVLGGQKGYAAQRAMELLVAIGTVYDAERLLPISSAHLSGVSYKTIGEGGLEFLTEMASDAKVAVKTTLNPAGMDLARWRDMNVSERFAERQLEIIERYSRMGVETICTCTPYLAGNLPREGDTVAWAESSALSYINSIVGARTNREGGPGALAASILGKTPAYGMHFDSNRMPTVVVEAEIEGGILDYTLLGQVVGKKVANGVPYFRNIRPNLDEAKTLAAAMAASGAVAMFHIEGVTPEAKDVDLRGLERLRVGREDLVDARNSLSTGTDPDLIALGCPHLSETEIREIASMLKGKSKKREIDIWFCTSKSVVRRCSREIAVLERFGRVLCDTCMVVSPVEEHHSCTATNSAKACNYLPTLCSQKVVCASVVELMGMIT
ncbi:MAG: aconitase X catalytic domain-containing protein [Methanomassiliicoccales archaeon]|nr:aconitase X catalytic domain-containing protein [Methanomassiliicoccales archaeon]